MERFQHESSLTSFGENRILHKDFRGVHQIMKQPTTFFILFQYPSMNFNRNNVKIPIKKIGSKFEKKKLGAPLAFFSIFSSFFF